MSSQVTLQYSKLTFFATNFSTYFFTISIKLYFWSNSVLCCSFDGYLVLYQKISAIVYAFYAWGNLSPQWVPHYLFSSKKHLPELLSGQGHVILYNVTKVTCSVSRVNVLQGILLELVMIYW